MAWGELNVAKYGKHSKGSDMETSFRTLEEVVQLLIWCLNYTGLPDSYYIGALAVNIHRREGNIIQNYADCRVELTECTVLQNQAGVVGSYSAVRSVCKDSSS